MIPNLMKKGAVLAFLLLFMHVGALYAEEKSIYKKVTSTNELVKGSQYIIVRENDTQAYAMGKIGGSKSGAGAKVAVTLQGDMIINPSTDAVVYTLGVSDGFWTLKCSRGYLSARDAETNMEYKGSVGTYSKWDITTTYIKCSNQSSRYLRYSENYGFKCYAGNVGSPGLTEEECCLYRLVESVVVPVGSLNYATLYYGNVALVVPENVKAYTYKLTEGRLAVSKTYLPGQTVPAGTPVVVAAAQGHYSFAVSPAEGEGDAANLLRGSDASATTTPPSGDASDYYFYMLSLNANSDVGSAGFYFGEDGGAPFTNGAHKAYLVLPKSEVTSAKSFLMTDMTTGISRLAASQQNQPSSQRYNLAGQRVSLSYRGIAVVQGKKIVVR